jgi:hypothetical protein
MYKLLLLAMVGFVAGQNNPGVYTKAGNLHLRAPGAASFARYKLESVTSDEIQANQKANQASTTQATRGVTEIEAGDSSISSGITKAKAAVGDVQSLASAIAAIEQDSEDLIKEIDDKLKEGTAAFQADLADAQTTLADEIDEKFNKLRAELSNNRDELDDVMKVQLVSAESTAVDLQDAADTIMEKIEAHEECMNVGQIYDEKEDECVEGAAEAKDMIGKVWYRMFNNDDGREGGYVNERYVDIDKKVDDTYVRVVYYDNFRVHGHRCYANWNVMFCDSNGNGCAECRDPGKINNHKWGSHQGNWWMNDHIHGTVLGICKKSDNRDLRKGKYRLRVMINHAYRDTHTGSGGNNHFMVDEVLRY